MLSSDIGKLFDLLPGVWQFERAVPENQATMTGTAQFDRAAKSVVGRVLNYRETGFLNWQGQHEVFRSYRYELESAASAISTYFTEGPDAGKLFERLTLDDKSSAQGLVTLCGDHLCIDDRYDSTYTFLDADHFTVVHRVEGPAKSYVSTTHYSRISTQP